MEYLQASSENDSGEYEKYHLDSNTLESLYSKTRQRRVLEYICNESIERVIEVGIGAHPLVVVSSVYKPKMRVKLASVEPRLGFLSQKTAETDSDFVNRIFNVKFEDVIDSEVSTFLGGVPDLIVLNSILHEIDNLEVFFQKLLTFVGPQTKVWVNVPNANSLHLIAYERLKKSKLFATEEDSFRSALSNRKNSFSADSLIMLFSRMDMICTNVTSYGYKPFTFRQMESIYSSDSFPLFPHMEALAEMELSELFGAEIEMIFESNGV